MTIFAETLLPMCICLLEENKTTHRKQNHTHTTSYQGCPCQFCVVGELLFFLSIVYSRCLSLSSSKMKTSSSFAHQPREVKFLKIDTVYDTGDGKWSFLQLLSWPLHSFGRGQLALSQTAPTRDSGASTGQKLTRGSIGGISQFWKLRDLSVAAEYSSWAQGQSMACNCLVSWCRCGLR